MLFLSAATIAHGNGRLNVRVINTVWNEACDLAGAGDHTPHAARHAMGRHLIDKTGNIAAVQRQLGHTNPAYSMQYARIPIRNWAMCLMIDRVYSVEVLWIGYQEKTNSLRGRIRDDLNKLLG